MSEKRRNWCQFSLRTLLLVMLVVAAFLAGWATQQRRVEAIRAKMERVEQQLRAEAERAREIAEEARHACDAFQNALVPSVDTEPATRLLREHEEPLTESKVNADRQPDESLVKPQHGQIPESIEKGMKAEALERQRQLRH